MEKITNAVNAAVGLCIYYADEKRENLEYLVLYLGGSAQMIDPAQEKGSLPSASNSAQTKIRGVLHEVLRSFEGDDPPELTELAAALDGWIPRVQAEMEPIEAQG